MKTQIKVVLAQLFLLMLASGYGQEKKDKLLDIPTEIEVGRVFMASLVTSMLADPPERILIYPMIYENAGAVHLAEHVGYVIEGQSVAEFVRDRLGFPSRIATTDTSCPNIIFVWNTGNKPSKREGSPILEGQILIYGDSDLVRLRLYTGNGIYPKIDFVYENTGLKDWLQKRAVLLQKPSH